MDGCRICLTGPRFVGRNPNHTGASVLRMASAVIKFCLGQNIRAFCEPQSQKRLGRRGAIRTYVSKDLILLLEILLARFPVLSFYRGQISTEGQLTQISITLADSDLTRSRTAAISVSPRATLSI